MIKDIKGQKFGRLKVVSFHSVVNTNALWNCICECGNKITVHACSLKTGATKSCGCLRGQVARDKPMYGEHKTKEYHSWSMMRNRCSNKNATQYSWYGARGITVCDRWSKYENFLNDMGRAPSSKHSIDRVDNSGNYEPSNCKWSTPEEQATNKRGLRIILYMGKAQSLSRWCKELNLNYDKVYNRIFKFNWPLERAFK